MGDVNGAQWRADYGQAPFQWLPARTEPGAAAA